MAAWNHKLHFLLAAVLALPGGVAGAASPYDAYYNSYQQPEATAPAVTIRPHPADNNSNPVPPSGYTDNDAYYVPPGGYIGAGAASDPALRDVSAPDPD